MVNLKQLARRLSVAAALLSMAAVYADPSSASTHGACPSSKKTREAQVLANDQAKAETIVINRRKSKLGVSVEIFRGPKRKASKQIDGTIGNKEVRHTAKFSSYGGKGTFQVDIQPEPDASTITCKYEIIWDPRNLTWRLPDGRDALCDGGDSVYVDCERSWDPSKPSWTTTFKIFDVTPDAK